jgi:hypothetical protein
MSKPTKRIAVKEQAAKETLAFLLGTVSKVW